MTLLLSRDEVEKLLTPEMVVNTLDEAFGALADGRAATMLGREVIVSRNDVEVPGARAGHVYHGLEVQSGSAPYVKTASVRIKSDILYWPEVNGEYRRKKFPAAPGGKYCGLVILFDTDTGEPKAIMPDGLIQRMRVGATSALGAKYLSNPDAHILAVIGAGFQAESQVLTLSCVRNLAEIRVYSPTAASREGLAARLSESTDARVTAASTLEEAVSGAHLVHAATNSRSPVLRAELLEPGMHVSVIGVSEISEDILRASDVAGTSRHHDPKEGNTAFADGYAEDYHESEMLHGWWHNTAHWSRMVHLGQLINGQAVGRRNATDITSFISKGAAVQFSAVGAKLLEAALAEGMGNELPTDWLLQPETP